MRRRDGNFVGAVVVVSTLLNVAFWSSASVRVCAIGAFVPRRRDSHDLLSKRIRLTNARLWHIHSRGPKSCTFIRGGSQSDPKNRKCEPDAIPCENRPRNRDQQDQIAEVNTSCNDHITSSSEYDATDAEQYDREEADIIQGYYAANGDERGNYDTSHFGREEVHPFVRPPEIHARRLNATGLRVEGKEHHDTGDLGRAAEIFLSAANELEAAINIFEDLPEDQKQESELAEMIEEAATCRLHEALCHLKRKEYALCIQSCSNVLDDGVQVVPFESDEEEENAMTEDESATDMEDEGEQTPKRKAAVVRVTPTGGAGEVAAKSKSRSISRAARARALCRRAKARLALEDITGALEDAKEAAYLGDRNGVSLYGRLIRESSSGSVLGGTIGSSPSDLLSNQGRGGLDELFGGTSPLLSAFGSGANDTSNAGDPRSELLLSMLRGSSGTSGVGGNALSHFGGLGTFLGTGSGARKGRKTEGGGAGGGGGAFDGLAKSVLKSLANKIDDETTQSQICNFLKSADKSRLTTYASMAGVQLPDETADRLVTFANGVTKEKLKRTVNFARRGVSAVKICSKVFKVIQKYKHLIVLALILQWVKSSVCRDTPINKKALRLAATEAAKKALVN